MLKNLLKQTREYKTNSNVKVKDILISGFNKVPFFVKETNKHFIEIYTTSDDTNLKRYITYCVGTDIIERNIYEEYKLRFESIIKKSNSDLNSKYYFENCKVKAYFLGNKLFALSDENQQIFININDLNQLPMNEFVFNELIRMKLEEELIKISANISQVIQAYTNFIKKQDPDLITHSDVLYDAIIELKEYLEKSHNLNEQT